MIRLFIYIENIKISNSNYKLVQYCRTPAGCDFHLYGDIANTSIDESIDSDIKNQLYGLQYAERIDKHAIHIRRCPE